MPKTFKITTLGCKVNQFESESIARQLQDHDWVAADAAEPADVCIVNTCTVTGKASMQSRQTIRQAVRANPCARIIVTGCYAESEPDAIAQISGVAEVVSQQAKFSLPQRLLSDDPAKIDPPVKGRQASPFDSPIALGLGSRSRPFLKIQDGCDAFCAYCIVPHTRGPSRSMAPDRVIECLGQIREAGYCETVLTGIHLGRWGLDLKPATDLLALLGDIRRRELIPRIRLSSIEPAEVTSEMIDFARQSQSGAGRICPHFHIPLQSGDNEVLRRMRRPYDRDLFAEKINAVHSAIPHAAIGTDVLVGFPGETEAAFQNTVNLISELPVTYLHVFPFSPRPGTPADPMPGRVPDPVVKKRCEKLRTLGKQKKSIFYNQFIDKTLEVLIEGRPGRKGMSANYIPVLLKQGSLPANRIAAVTVESVTDDLKVVVKVLDQGRQQN